MVYNTRNKRMILDDNKTVELTDNEHKLLIALSSEKFTPYAVIQKYVYR